MSRICNEPAEITIPEIKDAEVCAMMQAMYSRSNTRIKVRLNELDLEGEEKRNRLLVGIILITVTLVSMIVVLLQSF